jgi:hypothetical protein
MEARQMKLPDVRKVKESKDTEEVNKLIEDGWRIIRIFPASTATPDGFKTSALYVLGGKKEQ